MGIVQIAMILIGFMLSGMMLLACTPHSPQAKMRSNGVQTSRLAKPSIINNLYLAIIESHPSYNTNMVFCS